MSTNFWYMYDCINLDPVSPALQGGETFLSKKSRAVSIIGSLADILLLDSILAKYTCTGRKICFLPN